MAQTIREIKKSMTDEFMKNEDLRKAYGITGEEATWDGTFSAVSVENLLLYIVATAIHALEVVFDRFRADMDGQIAQNIVPTVRWYHTQAMAFQLGDSLQYDETAGQFRYPDADESKRIVRYAAVRDLGGSVQVLVSKDSGGRPAVLSGTELAAFTAYMNQVKVAGVILSIDSLEADSIRIYATVQVDPQVIDLQGNRLSDGSRPVEDAVARYLAGIAYGGTFNKTKCVDAIQGVEGVLDVELESVQARAASSASWGTVAGNNYTAVAGCLASEGLDTSIQYVL